MANPNLNLLQLNAWIDADPDIREALMVKEAPIAKSTLKRVLCGKYIPHDRTINAMKAVMERHPQGGGSGGQSAASA